MKCIAAALLGALMSLSSAAAPPVPERVFISGHSLVDQPLPSNLAAIATSLGTPLQWNRQYRVGSSIRARTRGDRDAGWDGYRLGYNREGEGLDLLAEWQRPQTVSGGRYDTLLITEQHGLLGTLLWNDTVRHLRHYHDRFIDANPAGRTWFYESWLGLDDKSDPRRWIAYERAASPLWQCIGTRINASLAAAGRADRIEPLPAGWALAFLIERLTTGAGVPGLSGPSVRDSVDRVVQDDVHLTPLGNYYMALVSYAHLFGRTPQGAWAPPEVATAAVGALQALAWQSVAAERAQRKAMTLEACRSTLQREFIALFWDYLRDAELKRGEGKWRVWWSWAQRRAQWHWRLRESAPEHPLRFDAATDAAYWFKAP
jgi:hypothetical protein